MAEPQRRGREHGRIVKLAFGVMALLSLLAGAVLFYFAERFGFDQHTAKIVALAFLIAGLVDYLILHYWDRLFTRRS